MSSVSSDQPNNNALLNLLMNKIEFTPIHEICLPSGQFASFRDIYAADVMIAEQGITQPVNYVMLICKILARVCRIDEEEKDVLFFLNLNMANFQPLQTYISTYLRQIDSKGVG